MRLLPLQSCRTITIIVHIKGWTMNRYVNVRKMSITLDKGIAEELDAMAQELGEKKSHLIQKALSLYFDKLDEEIADRRLRELEEGRTRTVPAEEVWKELGI